MKSDIDSTSYQANPIPAMPSAICMTVGARLTSSNSLTRALNPPFTKGDSGGFYRADILVSYRAVDSAINMPTLTRLVQHRLNQVIGNPDQVIQRA